MIGKQLETSGVASADQCPARAGSPNPLDGNAMLSELVRDERNESHMDGPGSAVGRLSLRHVDVFTDRSMAGNGLAVVTPVGPLAGETMLRIAQELRQFETIFLFDVADDGAEARIFTPEEELKFAGHPVLGAAAVLHAQSDSDAARRVWTIRVGGRPLRVTTALWESGIIGAEMDQGPAVVSTPLSRGEAHRFAAALGLRPEQLREDLPSQVVSTGLPYLLLPVTAEGLATSHVAVADLPSMLDEIGADFVYVLDPDMPEGRTWDNRGVTEDVATGSAAGPAAAYLVRHGLRPADESFHVHQGRFVGRPSRIDVRLARNGSIHVGGLVAPFSSGTIELAAVRPGRFDDSSRQEM
jgi:PhzF family phenazine biosynthesis protein